MFGLPTAPDGLAGDPGLTDTMVSGDVLFAGSIGRTDLPGGSTPRCSARCATWSCRWPTPRWCSPATAPPRRCAGARHEPVPAGLTLARA